MNYTPSILPSDVKDLLPWLNRELQIIARVTNEKTERLGYATAILTPASLTGNTDNYAPAGLEGVLWLRLGATIPVNLTGLKNPEASTPRMIFVSNILANTITLVHASGSSAAAARFNLPGAANKALTQHAGILLGYDPSSAIWRALAVAT